MLNNICKEEFLLFRDFAQKQFSFNPDIYQNSYICRKLNEILVKFRLNNIESLIKKLNDDPSFIEVIKSEITPLENEFFRDPDMWAIILNEIIPLFVKKKGQVSVLFPELSNGVEILSLAMLIQEFDFSSDVRICSYSENRIQINKFRQFSFSKDMLNSGMINFAKICPKSDMNKYFSLYEKQLLLNQALLKKVSMDITENSHNETAHSEKYDIIFFRNKLLYYKTEHCEQIFSNLQSLISDSGFLITGTRDILPSNSSSTKLKLLNMEERIYQKIRQ